MAGHEWEDWFEREEFIGQISDIRVQNLQVEREVVQKRTFTRWMNLHLEKCNPPLEVHDLFRDIQDGKILMALLEELSGCRLLHAFKQSSHRIFRLNNIAKVLTFLEERNVKLVSIDAADIADGNSSIVLGLIWNIILFFQIKELTGNIKNQFPSSSSLSSIPTSSDSDTSHSSTPSDERRPSVAARDHGKAIKTLLHWVQRRTRKYGVAVQDFGKSWASGLAFLAVIKSIDPSLVDMRRALLRSSKENIEEAFRTAHYSLGIPRLLEPEDVTMDPPEDQSIMTYVSQFLEHFPGIEEDEHSDFLERSRVSARMSEPPVRNGVQRKREKSYVVKRDWVQPPPKIFISSVTEEHAQTPTPAQPQTPEDRPWTSEEGSVGSSPSTADSRPLCRPLGLNKDGAASPSSPQPSPIDSPDSWGEMPSETAPQLQQSCSDGSLSDLRYSTSPGELTSESPLLLERVSQDQVDTDLFTDEGNFSLSSMESLPVRSALLSEEEDAYRYIMDLKEDGSADHVPSEDIVNDPDRSSPEQNPETVKPESHTCGDSDSGYYPGHKEVEEASTTELDNVSSSSVLAEQVSEFENPAESQSGLCKESLESPTFLTEPNPAAFFEDDPECPVLKYERISISGSEEDGDAELSEEAAHNEEPEENDVMDVFSSDTRANEGSEERQEEPAYLREAQEAEQVLHLKLDYQETSVEPEEDNYGGTEDRADLVWEISTHRSPSGADPEIQREEDQTSGSKEPGMCEEPVMKDSSEASPEAAKSLAGENFTEVEEETSGVLNKSVEEPSETEAWNEEPGQNNMSSTQRDVDDQNGSTGCLEIEPSTCEDAAEEEPPCSQHDDSQLEDPQVELLYHNHHPDGDHTSGQHDETETETEEHTPYTHHRTLDFTSTDLDKTKDDLMQQPETPQDDLLVSSLSKILQEPRPDPDLCEPSHTPPSPSSPTSQPDWDQSAAEQPYNEQSQGRATWEETERIMGTPERAERYPAELRLSLSVTPLQPAPSQLSCPDSERESQDKVGEGSVESPEHSPFELWSRHPGEWGAVDSDLHADHCELISSDEELSASAACAPSTAAAAAAARENTESLREEEEEEASEGTEDDIQPSTALCLEEVFDSEESKMENGESADAIVTKNTSERKEESDTAGSSESEVTLSEIHLLLLMWLLVYCLFILPQIDIWAIPGLLLNLEE